MPKPTPAEVAQGVADMLNTFLIEEVNDEFVREMLTHHKTLQQNFTRLCFHWFYTLAEQENYDDRNKRSVELAREVVKALGPKEPYMPFI